ncbi:alpha/beta hydrolase [Actinocorallia sp. A-T 12471]|uniref:alpha/beta fold hydrolase n=1 Tax=Actinocorallia sp. A-T 12471 TaxID=3089813 RepID=UPI0029CDB97A|nr:alpha/beta hydrolase [Actinocorallia sp. A-T 12471]MDX6738807.1 alpha/beta hydrolase [Actinocorallia sp. A-T 12471]
MTEYLNVEGGRISYEVAGEGPLVVLSHGIGDRRQAFRYLSAALLGAGYRVASVDLRGHGESDTGFASHTRADTAADLLALIRHLGGPAILVGHSFSAGSAALAAVEGPEEITAIVQIGPGTRTPSMRLRDVSWRFVKGMTLILGATLLRSVRVWRRYLDHAYPGVRPADYEAQMSALTAKMAEPGRMAAFAAMMTSSAAESGAALPRVAVPALVIMGTMDPDFTSPRGEAEDLARILPRGEAVMIEGSGHYPHAQHPAETNAAVLGFLKAHALA